MTTLSTLTRAALTVALLALAAIFIWAGMTRTGVDQRDAVPLLVSAVLPLAAAGLLFIRRGIGTALAIFAALLGALAGVGLTGCLFTCPAGPLSTESILLLVAALTVFVLVVVELLAWLVIRRR